MFTKKNQPESPIEAEITSALTELAILEKTDVKYGILVDQISKLHKLKTEDRPKRRISPDTALVVAANVFGILWLARYERENVIKSKTAMGFVFKPR